MIRRPYVVFVCACCALVAGVFAFQQWQTVAALKKRVATLTSEAQSKDAALQEQSEIVARLRAENESYVSEAATLRGRLARMRASSESKTEQPLAPDSSPNGLADSIRRLFDKPKTAAAAAATRQSLTSLIQDVYAEFITSRHLSEDQANQLRALLIEKGAAQTEDGENLLAGDGANGANAAYNAQRAAERIDKIDAAVRSLLGEGVYADFLDYNNKAGERVTWTRVQRLFSESGTSLGSQEANTLLQVMMEERARTPPSPLAPADVSPRVQFRDFLNSPNQEQLYQNEADLQQRVINRVAGILSPDQLAVLQTSLKESLESDKLFFEMARVVSPGRNQGTN